MRILLTNDDGIDAPGIIALEEELKKRNHEILVVAPDRQQSATSHSITLHEPLRIFKRGENRYATTGTPTDCVTLAVQVIMKEPVDLVISGINAGQNMGEDVLYSGTVAAALEGMFLGFPSIAISIASYSEQEYSSAAFHLSNLLNKNIHHLIAKDEIFNINFPNIKQDEIEGFKITKLGHRHYENFVVQQEDPRGRTIYWIGGDKPFWCFSEGTDAKAISENFISITPVSPKFTNSVSFEKLENWLEELR
jgi:5'-nucleotidase